MEHDSSLELSLVTKHTVNVQDLRQPLLSDLFVLDNIRNNKSKEKVKELGGIEGLCHSVNSHRKYGIQGDKDDRKARKESFGKNKPHQRKARGFLALIWECFQDTTLQILIVAAIVSLVVGTIQHPEDGWLQGTAILIAVAIVVLVTSINNYVKELQFRKLNQEAQKRLITVTRDNKEFQISIFKLLVGDIVKIGAGDILPVDAYILWSVGLHVDESSMTGEADILKKGHDQNQQPFLISGSQVTDGSATVVVLAVGHHSFQGKVSALLNEEEVEDTPLQKKLNRISQAIGWIGFSVALFTFLVLLVYIIIDAVDKEEWDSECWDNLISSFIIAVTIIVVAVPEGLPLAVTLSLAFSVGQMKKLNNLVRHLDASETMGQATNICSDKTGTLTVNIMTVVALYSQNEMYETIQKDKFSPRTLDFLIQNICHNSAASTTIVDGKKTFTGSRTEIALLDMAQDWDFDYTQIRDPDLIVAQVPFSSKIKKMQTVIRHQGRLHVLVKGASQVVLNMCNRYIDTNGDQQELSQEKKTEIYNTIIADYASRAMRTLTMAYKVVDQDFKTHNDQGEVDCQSLESELVLLGIAGIQDPIRKNVPEAVSTCHHAGIVVRMVTGDNKDTAVAIARQAHILPGDYNYEPNDNVVMEGEEFRTRVEGLKNNQQGNKEVGNLQEFQKIVAHLRVLARSSPDDKFILVTGLRQLNEVVAVTGDGSNDAPALKKSNVGFAMHEAGTQLAQEAADIILLDDNFASIVTAVLWGRNIYDCISKFIQFQLTVNLVALLLCFIGACVLKVAPLTAVQMLWVNLIMDTFAALALATEPPNNELLNRMPVKPDDSLITPQMMKTIIGQSIYQGAWLLVILFLGPDIFDIDVDYDNITQYNQENAHLFTIFFNTFVFMQVFNEINCRKLKSSELNVFKGFFNNWMFLFIIITTIVVQVIIVTFGGEPLNVVSLDIVEHLWCILIGLGGLVFGFFVRLIPARPFKCCKFSEKPLDSAEADKGINSLMRRRTTKKIIGGNRALIY